MQGRLEVKERGFEFGGQSLARGWRMVPPGLEVGESWERDSLPPPTLSTSLPTVGPRAPREGQVGQAWPPQLRSCLPFTVLTLPACACVLPRAWLSCTLIQLWRGCSRELLSCVQRGTERRGWRALIIRKLAWD